MAEVTLLGAADEARTLFESGIILKYRRFLADTVALNDRILNRDSERWQDYEKDQAKKDNNEIAQIGELPLLVVKEGLVSGYAQYYGVAAFAVGASGVITENDILHGTKQSLLVHDLNTGELFTPRDCLDWELSEADLAEYLLTPTQLDILQKLHERYPLCAPEELLC